MVYQINQFIRGATGERSLVELPPEFIDRWSIMPEDSINASTLIPPSLVGTLL
jgi:hypothetical protein